MPLWMVSSAGIGIAHPLEPAAFQLALDAQAAVLHLDFHDDRGVRQARAARRARRPTWANPWSSDCSPVSTRSTFSSRSAAASASAMTNASASRERIVLDVNGAVGSAGQRLAQGLGHAGRAGGADDHFAAVLLLEAERLFERVRVRLVQLEGGILVAHPRLGVVQPKLPLAGDDLLDADSDFHSASPG